MKIALVRPPTVIPRAAAIEEALPPIGLAYLASTLKKYGHSVVGIDAIGDGLSCWGEVEGWPEVISHGLSIEETVGRIPSDIQLIGVSCMFSATWPYVHMVLDAIRKEFPHAVIIVGGEHVTAVPEYILKTCQAIDYCVLGEGEGPMLALVNALTSSDNSKSSIASNVPGIVSMIGGKVLYGPPAKRIRTIDDIPDPDWSLFPVKKYLDAGLYYGVDRGISMPIMASRGCPYRCAFCSSPRMWTTLWRARDPQNVVNEMKRYIAEYKATNFDFFDLTAVVKKEWIISFAKLIMEQLPPVTWQLPSGTRSEAIDAETSKYMYDSGCRNIIYAPESASRRTLALIKKKVDPDNLLRSMRASQINGIETKANMMMGFPGERKRDLIPNLFFFVRMAWAGVQDATCFPFSPYPGSELFRQLQQKGRIELNDEYFRSLFKYSPNAEVISYSEHMSNSFVRWFSLMAMALFYGSSLVLHPSRAWRLFHNIVIKKHPETRLEKALFSIYSKGKPKPASC